MTRTSRTVAAAAVALMTAFAVVVPAGAAQAGGSCSSLSGCSRVENVDKLFTA